MGNAQHTPGQLGEIVEQGPYSLAIDWPETDERYECGSDHYPVTVTSGDPDELRANAERVRLCWNCHDDLLAALECARDIADQEGYDTSTYDAAIAKAKGQA